MNRGIKIAIALLVSAIFSSAAMAGTLDDVKKRGHLQCGINTSLAGFGSTDAQGNSSGFDVDFCRALAAAIGVDVKFTPLTAKDRFPALQSGEVDVLFRNTTYTMSRDTKLGFDFVGVNYYDGQGFIVRKKSKVTTARKLNNATVCVQTGTTTELNLADYFRANKMKYKQVLFEKVDDARMAYDTGRCDSYTTDASGLAAERTKLKTPEDHIILPEIISKEPLGPAVRHGDNQWADIVRWVLNLTIIAEEKDITQANVEKMVADSQDPDTQRTFGKIESHWVDIGLDAASPVRAIKTVGNYGEIFERNIGKKTALRLERGLNQLWNKGGILYAPPVR